MECKRVAQTVLLLIELILQITKQFQRARLL
jgi:hypothetical protein